MKRKQLAVALVGSFVAILGMLWFLQGAAILRLCSVLCVANCECVLSGSEFWEEVGVITLIGGITIISSVVWRERITNHSRFQPK